MAQVQRVAERKCSSFEVTFKHCSNSSHGSFCYFYSRIKNFTHGTFDGYRSALALVLQHEGCSIGTHPVLNQLMKSFELEDVKLPTLSQSGICLSSCLFLWRHHMSLCIRQLLQDSCRLTFCFLWQQRPKCQSSMSLTSPYSCPGLEYDHSAGTPRGHCHKSDHGERPIRPSAILDPCSRWKCGPH